jgi:hypothetical protein
VKSLVGAHTAERLYQLGASYRPEADPEVFERVAPVAGEVYRIRAIYCPRCGRHYSRAVPAGAIWPASVPHIPCPSESCPAASSRRT